MQSYDGSGLTEGFGQTFVKKNHKYWNNIFKILKLSLQAWKIIMNYFRFQTYLIFTGDTKVSITNKNYILNLFILNLLTKISDK